MYIRKYSKNALFVIFCIFLIVFSASCINATEINHNDDCLDDVSDIDINLKENNHYNQNKYNRVEDNTNNTDIKKHELLQSKNNEDNIIGEEENLTDISINAPDVVMKQYDKTPLIINLQVKDPNIIEGKYVKILLDNSTYYRPIHNCQANLTLYNSIGNYTAICIFNYTGFKYAYCTSNIEVKTNKLDTYLKVDCDELEMDYKDGTPYIVRLIDENELPITRASVKITVNNRIYYKTTDDEGYADIPLNFVAGEYSIVTTYNGDNNHKKSNITSTLIIHKLFTYIIAQNTELYYQNGTVFVARIIDSNNQPLNNSYITIELNNRTYYKRSNEVGLIELNLTMKPGTYDAIINYPGTNGYENSNSTVKITVLPYKTEILSKNIIMYYKNGTELEGELFVINPYTNEKLALNGSFLTITINNRIYYRTSDEYGKFNLSLNFKSGNYTALINYKSNRGYEGCNLTVNITILNITTKINSLNTHKYYRDDTLFTANLVNQFGQALVGEYLNITIGDKKYVKQTNSNGDINLTVNLESGIYDATIIYNGKNGYSSFKKNVQIIVEDRPINIVSMGADIEKGNNYFVQVYDNYGSTLSNVNVVFEFNNRTYYKYTDSNGIAAIPINLAPNNYNILVKPGTHYTGNYLKETITVYKDE